MAASRPDLIHRVLVGATGSGKKSVAVRLAERHGLPVLSMDSMKVYRGMDIGTDKPSPDMLARVPFGLIDLVGHDESFSAGHWIAAARAQAEQIGGGVLFAGGTPLYLRLLTRGIFDGPGSDPGLRSELDEFWEQAGEPAVRERLARVDPELESRLLPGDRKRLLRGLEVQALTGQPLSRLQAEQTRPPVPGRFVLAALRHPADVHRQRIEDRVARMLAAGLVDEVAGLVARADFAVEPARAIGYAEALACLAGTLERHEMQAAIVQRTSRMVRKQGTFLRSFAELRWVDVAPGQSLDGLVAQVERALDL